MTLALPQRECLASIIKATGADTYFDLVVAATLQKLRRAMSAPPPGTDARVDTEFDAIREMLAKFYPEYEQTYGALLAQHLDSEQLSGLATLLQTDVLRAYFRATQDMGEALAGSFDELGSRMLHHARYRAAE